MIVQSKTIKPKWKDPKTSNVEIQAQVNVGGVGIRERFNEMMGQPSKDKLSPIGGARNSRWRL